MGGRELGDDVIDRIISRADGVPLFVEELTKSVLEVDDVESEIKIPETLRALLTARLDRLGEAKEIAHIGAAIGREYPLDVVRAIAAKLGLEVDVSHEKRWLIPG